MIEDNLVDGDIEIKNNAARNAVLTANIAMNAEDGSLIGVEKQDITI